MKTKKNPIAVQSLKIIALMTMVLLFLVAFSSCAAKKKVITKQTEMAPPPPPPPPPAINSKSGIEVKAVKANNMNEEEPFVVVEEMPTYPGGDSALLEYISQNVKYPENAKKNNIQGKVILRFCITAKGNVDRVSVLRGVDPEIDAEAFRVVSSLPPFKPGRQGGKEVPVWYMVPVIFALK
jgi:TonB family protein